jgi:hypothetical protein
METYVAPDGEHDVVETGDDELQTCCTRRGRTEMEHELAPAGEGRANL